MKTEQSAGLRIFRRTLVYMIMVVAVVAIVALLVFMLLGYQIGKDGKISQGGLVQFGTNPGGATVKIDDVKFGSTTPTQSTLGSGQHTFEYQKSGYRNWQKTLDLTPAEVLWVNYARLIPITMTPKSVATYPSVAGTLASPDNTTMAVVSVASEPKLALVNLENDQVKTKDVTLPPDSFTAPKTAADQSFTLTSWSANSRYLLIKHTYDGATTEWLRLDTQNPTAANAVINLTTALGINVETLTFRPNNADQLYALSTDTHDLRRIDLNATTISAPLALDVSSYTVAGDGLLTYVTNANEAGARAVGYVSDGSTKSQVLRTFSSSQNEVLRAASGNYYDQRFVAISKGAEMTIYAATLPGSGSNDGTLSLQQVGDVTLPFSDPESLTNATRGRFMVAQKGTEYAVDDLELGRFTTAKFTGQSSQNQSARAFGWLDNYMLYSSAGGQLQVAEFDGGNHQSLFAAVDGLDTTLSPNGKWLYAFTTAKDGQIALSRARMILN